MSKSPKAPYAVDYKCDGRTWTRVEFFGDPGPAKAEAVKAAKEVVRECPGALAKLFELNPITEKYSLKETFKSRKAKK